MASKGNGGGSFFQDYQNKQQEQKPSAATAASPSTTKADVPTLDQYKASQYARYMDKYMPKYATHEQHQYAQAVEKTDKFNQAVDYLNSGNTDSKTTQRYLDEANKEAKNTEPTASNAELHNKWMKMANALEEQRGIDTQREQAEQAEAERQTHAANFKQYSDEIKNLQLEGQNKSQIWVDGIYMGEDKQIAGSYAKRIADLQEKAEKERQAADISGENLYSGKHLSVDDNRLFKTVRGSAKTYAGQEAKYFGATAEAMDQFTKEHGEQLGTNTSDYAGWATDELSAAQIGQEYDPTKIDKQIEANRQLQETGRNLYDRGNADLESAKDGLGFAGSLAVDLGSNATQMGIDALFGPLSMAALYTRAAGGGMLEAEAEGANLNQQLLYGNTVGAIEGLTEKMFGGLAKVYGKAGADDLVESVVRKLAKTEAGQKVLLFGADMLGEGIEEIVSDIASPFAKAIYDKGGSLKELGSWEGFKDFVGNALYDGLVGALMGAVGGGTKLGNGPGSYTETAQRLQVANQTESTLLERGVGEKDAKDLAAIIAKQTTGEELSKNEQQKLESSEAATALANEMHSAKAAAPAEPVEVSTMRLFFDNGDNALKANAASWLGAKIAGGETGNILSPETISQLPAETQAALTNTEGAEECTQNVMNYIADQVRGTEGWTDEQTNAATSYVLGTLSNFFQKGMEVDPKRQQNIAAEAVEFAKSGMTLDQAIDAAQQSAQKAVTAKPKPAPVQTAQPAQDSTGTAWTGDWDSWVEAALSGGALSDTDINTIYNRPEARQAFEEHKNVSLEGKSEEEAKSIIGMAAGTMAKPVAQESAQNASGEDSSQGGTSTRPELLNALEGGLNSAEKKADTPQAKRGSGTVSFDGAVVDGRTYQAVDKSSLNKKQKAQIAVMEKIAEATGVNVTFFQSSQDERGRFTGANGLYKDGTIYLDVNAGLYAKSADGKKTVGEIALVRTAAHEMTHFIEQFNETEYNAIRDYMVDQLSKAKGLDGLEALIDQKMKRDSTGELTREGAIDEIIADGCEMMLQNSEAIEQLATENPNLAQKIQNWIKDWVAKIKAAFKGVEAVHEEAKVMMRNAEELQKKWDAALKNAAMNQKSETGITGGVTIGDNTADDNISVGTNPVVNALHPQNGKPLIQYQARTELEALPKQIFTVKGESRMLVDETGKNVNLSVRDIRNAVAQANGISADKIAKVNRFLDQVEKKMKGYELKYRFVGLQDIDNATILLDRSGNIILSAMVKNDEYAVNFDFTKLCKKRQALQQVIETLAREKGRASENGTTEVDLSAGNVQRINEMLAASGVETNCLGCFVEAKRANQQQLNSYILDDWNAIVDEVAPGAGYFHFADAKGEADLHDSEEDKAAFAAYREALSKLTAERKKEGKSVTPAMKARLLIENVPAARKKLTYSDLATERGRTRLHQEFPEIDSFAKARIGAASFKTVESFTPYNAEVELLGQKSVKVENGKLVVKKDDGSLRKELAKIGGARSQSFSDFIISHVYDVLQKTAGFAARGLPGHTYTKEISRATLFGKTGEKHNMSVLFEVDPNVDSWSAGLTKGGNYFVGDYQHFMMQEGQEGKAHFIQSIGFEDAKKLQNTDGYSKNCGIIAVPLSYRAYKKALADPDIRMIIGYHSSGMPVEVKSKTHYDMAADYQGVQNTQKVVGLVKPNYEIPEDVPSYATPPSDVKPIGGGSKTIKSDMTFDIKGRFEELSAGKTGDARTAAAKQTLQEFLDFMNENGLTAVTSKAEGGYGKFPLYDDVEKTRDPYLTADHYIEYCIEKGELPLFWEFATDQNYYKQLYDFNMFDRLTYNSKTGRHEDMPGREAYAPQEAIHLLDGDGELMLPKDFFGLMEKYTKDYNSQMEKVSEVVPGVLEKFKNETGLKQAQMSDREIQAIEKFGTTDDFAEAGFILPDGRMLRFTDDKHPGERNFDHRAIGLVFGKDVDLSKNHGFNEESGKDLEQFIEDGGIRFEAGDPDLNIDAGIQLSSSVPLTRKQEQAIRDFIEWKQQRDGNFKGDEYTLFNGPLALHVEFGGDANISFADVSEKDLNTWGVKNLIYQGGQINADRVIEDIRHYYRTGETRKPSEVSKFRYSDRDPQEIDNEYQEALDAKDEDWQMALVNEAAYNAGYTSGAYHGSPVTDITSFNTRSTGTKPEKMQLLFGTHFTRNKSFAELYAKKAKSSKGTSRMNYSKFGKVYNVYLDLGKSLDIAKAENYTPGSEIYSLYEDFPEKIRKKVPAHQFTEYETAIGLGSGKYVNSGDIESALQMMAPKDAVEFLTDHGYNSVLYNARYNHGSWDNNRFSRDESIIMLDPERIKSADPITYDDEGNIIPPSKRFDHGSSDIRFQERDILPESAYEGIESKDTADILAETATGKTGKKGTKLNWNDRSSGEGKTSEYYSNTATKNGKAKELNETNFKYVPIPEQKSIRRAATKVANNYDEVLADLYGNRTWLSEQVDAAWLISDKLHNEAVATGTKEAWDAYNKFEELIQDHATEAGAALQAFAKQSRPGSAAVMRAAQARINAIREAKAEAEKAGKTKGLVSEEALKKAEEKTREYATRMGKLEYEIDQKIKGGMSEETARNEAKNAYLDLIDEINTFRHTGLFQDAGKQADAREAAKANKEVKKLNTKFRKMLEKEDMEYIMRFAATDMAGISADTQYDGKQDFRKRLNTWQKLAQLTGTGTWLRNGVGNGSFGIVDVLAADNPVTILADALLSAKTGKRSSGFETGILNKVARDAAAHSLRRSILEVAANIDIDADSDTTKYDMGTTRTYDPDSENVLTRIGSRWEQWNGYMLQSSDAWFKGMAKGSAEAAIRKANHWDKGNLTKAERASMDKDKAEKLSKKRQAEIDETVRQIAEYRTFQNDSMLSKGADKAREGLNKLGAGLLGRKWQQGQFGLGTALMPYTKVPTNLAMKAVEFSPAGALNGLREMIQVMNNPKATMAQQQKAVTDFGRGVTGTALVAVMASLMKQFKFFRDWDDEEDKDVKAQNRAEGKYGMQFNIDMIKRWANGDKNPTWENGDRTLDISSMEPLNQLIGAASLLADDEELTAKGILEAFTKAAHDSLNNMPALQTLANIENTIRYTDTPDDLWQTLVTTTASTAGNVAGGMIPAPIKHYAALTDENVRDTSGKNAKERAINQAKSAVPGLRQTLPVKRDSFGNEMKAGDFATRFANQYDAFKHTQVNQSDVSRELERLREETGVSRMPSRNGPSSITFGSGKDKETIKLKGQERTGYKNVEGSVTNMTLEELFGLPLYKNADSDTQDAMVAELESFAKDTTKGYFADYNDIDYEGQYTAAREAEDPIAFLTTKTGFNLAKSANDWDAVDTLLKTVREGKLSESEQDVYEEHMTGFKKLYAMSGSGIGSKRVTDFADALKTQYESEKRTDARGSDYIRTACSGKFTDKEADTFMSYAPDISPKTIDNYREQVQYQLSQAGMSNVYDGVWDGIEQVVNGDIEKSVFNKWVDKNVPIQYRQELKDICTNYAKDRHEAGKTVYGIYDSVRAAGFSPKEALTFYEAIDANYNGSMAKGEYKRALRQVFGDKVGRTIWNNMKDRGVQYVTGRY